MDDAPVARAHLMAVPLVVVLAVSAERLQHQNGRSVAHVAGELAAGLALVVAGMVIGARRDATVVSWCLVVAGALWFVPRLDGSVNEDVRLVAFASSRWYEVPIVWALLAYPTGRPSSRLSGAVAGSLVVVVAIRSFARIFLHVPPDVAGYGTTNRFLPISDERWWRWVEDAFLVAHPVVLVAAVAIVASRWLRASSVGRRTITPALVAGVALAIVVALEDRRGWNTRLPGTSLPIWTVRYSLVATVAVALAVGFSYVRGSRSGVVELVGELTGSLPVSRLRDALARALDDPHLVFATWSPTERTFRDSAGVLVDVSSPLSGRAVTIVTSDGDPVAALEHDEVVLGDPGLVKAIVTAVRLTIDNERLRDTIESQLDEVERSRARIVEAGYAERRRLERDLHDGAQQRLLTIGLNLRLVEATATDLEPAVRAGISKAVTDLAAAIEELRTLARGLHPTVLVEAGLGPAIESLADRCSIPVRTNVEVPVELAPEVGAAAYFAVAESLANAIRHSKASNVLVNARIGDGRLLVEVTDNGCGGAEPGLGTGLRGIGDRVAAVGGETIISSHRGEGTRVEVRIPCGSPS